MSVESTRVSGAGLVLAGLEGKRTAPPAEGFRAHVAFACWGAGSVFLVGASLDVFILWVLQRVPGPAWEFTALAATIEGTPRIALAIALLAVGLFMRGSRSLWQYRALGLLMVMTGIAGLLVGLMLIGDYFVLRRDVEAAQMGPFQRTALKALALSAMHAFVLIPLGLLGLRRPRA